MRGSRNGPAWATRSRPAAAPPSGKGHKLTAASCFLRATRYYQTGERFLQPKSQRGMDVYAKSVKTFRDAAAIIRSPRIEHVEIPYEGTSLPALLVHPDRDGGRRPSGAGHGLSSTASTSPRRSSTATRCPISRRAASAA